jgi:hypothetical protein
MGLALPAVLQIHFLEGGGPPAHLSIRIFTDLVFWRERKWSVSGKGKTKAAPFSSLQAESTLGWANS